MKEGVFYLPKGYDISVKTLRVSGYVQASIPIAPVDDGMEWIPRATAITLLGGQYRAGAIALEVTGESMDDGTEHAICHGDIVLVDINRTFSVHHNNAASVFATNNGFITKERGMVKGRHCLVSRNPNFEPIFDQTGYRLIGSIYAKYEGPKRVRYLM